MPRIRLKIFCRDAGDHVTVRHASEYVYDPVDLDADGNPRAGMLRSDPIKAEEGEIEFDHMPTEAELDAAFPNRKNHPRLERDQ